MDADAPIRRLLSRREALALMGTTAGVIIATPWVSRLSPPANAQGASCVVRPEQTEGPYFVDERLKRSDIRTDPSDGSVSDGTRLALSFAVTRLDGSTCLPLQGAVVDVWHCDAGGVYSDVNDPGFNTTGRKFLRGYQVTDASGAVTFTTIWPGWYAGRTVHVHFKIRLDPNASSGFDFTSQLYFDDSLTDVVHAQQPYAAKGQRTRRNAQDGIFQDRGAELLLTPTGDGAGGYATTFNVALDLSGVTTTPPPPM